MIHIRQSHAVRWLWAGALRALGVAGVMLGSSVWSQEQCAPAACTPAVTGPSCQDCQKVFGDAADKLKNLNPGGCAPTSCAPGAGACTPACGPDCNSCNKVFEDAAAKLNNCNTGCAPAGCGTTPDQVFNSCGGCGGSKHGWLGGELGEPWSIMDRLPGAKERGWQIGGWTSWGYQSGPDGAFTGNGVFNNEYYGGGFNNAYEWDHFINNQTGVFIGKTATVDDCNPIAFGGRAELIYGADGNEFQSFGNNPGTYDFDEDFNHGIYEWALPQLYAEVAAGNHSLKVGHFYTLLGYEVLPNTGQFFMSRQLTFYNSEPFTHTGALVASKVNDKLTLHNGYVLGMDTGFDQFNNSSAYHGGFIYNFNDCTSLTNMLVWGNLGWRGDGFINSTILTHKWTDKLQSVHQFDVMETNLTIQPFPIIPFTRPVNFAVDGIAGDSIGQINYLFYDVNPRTKLGLRQEWYKADSVSYYTLTYGVNVKPMANLVVRPEVRHMWSPSANNTFFQPGRGDLFNQTVFGIDAVLSF
jgi:hypothetical protein